MQSKHYTIQKDKKMAEKITFSRKRMEGFPIKPHN